MKNRIRKIATVTWIVIALAVIMMACAGCGSESIASGGSWNTASDVANTKAVADNLVKNQPTPTDINYSLERYNLTRRAYWVNGQREKANAMVCPVEKPLGYIVLITEGGAVLGSYIVDGKVSSLNSYLTPDSEYYELVYGGEYSEKNKWIADVDGSYGENDSGIFFFTPNGNYMEWTGTYLYSDIPFEVADPILKVGE